MDPERSSTKQFSRFSTGLSAVVFATGVVLFGLFFVFSNRLDRVQSPQRALVLITSRGMDLEEALKSAPVWERLLYEIPGDFGDTLSQAIADFEELLPNYLNRRVQIEKSANRIMSLTGISENERHALLDPLLNQWKELNEPWGPASIELHLAILQAEAGKRDQLQAKLNEWKEWEEPFPLFARLIQTAYLDQGKPISLDDLHALQRLDWTVTPGWFRDQLEIHILRQADQRELLFQRQYAMAKRANLLRTGLRVVSGINLLLMLVGSFAMVMLFIRRGELCMSQIPVFPPPWSCSFGLIVLLRGAALAMVMMVVLIVLAVLLRWDTSLLALIGTLSYLPMFLMADEHLLAPGGFGFWEWLGLRKSLNQWAVGTSSVLSGFMISNLGAIALIHLGTVVGVRFHWAEQFPPDFMWGTPLVLVGYFVSVVVLAPVCEEIVFRGLLFGTLRRKWGFGLSATISAVIFASFHGYGLLGWLVMFWSGLVWARLYEKTKSLLPSICVHTLWNLFSFGGMMVLRFC